MTQVSFGKIQEFLNKSEINVEYFGSEDIVVNGFCSLNVPKKNCITWVKNVQKDSLENFDVNGSYIIVAKEIITSKIDRIAYIITDKPKAVFFSILDYFWKEDNEMGISQNSVVMTDKIGENVSVGANCFIGKDVVVGSQTVIENNVCIYHNVQIGNGCIIHSGAVIGADGFGYYINSSGVPEKVKHYGGVYIGNRVEVGANACIDRGTIDNTVIKSDSKIDNLVHIAHNVQIEENVMVVAGAVICGSSVLQQGSYVAPGGIVKNQITVAEGGFIGMGAVVTTSTQKNMVMAGIPAKPLREAKETDK